MNVREAKQIKYEVEWRNKKTDPDYQPSTDMEEKYQSALEFLSALDQVKATGIMEKATAIRKFHAFIPDAEAFLKFEEALAKLDAVLGEE